MKDSEKIVSLENRLSDVLRSNGKMAGAMASIHFDCDRICIKRMAGETKIKAHRRVKMLALEFIAIKSECALLREKLRGYENDID